MIDRKAAALILQRWLDQNHGYLRPRLGSTISFFRLIFSPIKSITP